MNPVPRAWTPAEDALIRSMWHEKKTWPEIAAAVGVSRYMAYSRARRIGLPKRYSPMAIASNPVKAASLYESKPPGHPETWGPLIALTPCLGDLPYG